MDTTPTSPPTARNADRRLAVGARGEDLAAAHLAAEGLEVVARNWRQATGELRGELDLVALDHATGTVVVCEVKTRRSDRFGGPLAAVTQTKQAQVRALAVAFLRAGELPYRTVRFDVIGVRLDHDPPRVQHRGGVLMLATVSAVALVGLEAHRVVVEATASQGLPGTRVVGLPDTAVREAADRVKSAARRSGLSWPDNRVTVNLAPAALRKSGAGFDLPMALAVLGATQQVPPAALTDLWAVGELGLDGTIRPVPGILPMAAAARDAGARLLLVASAAAVEASLVDGLEVVPVDSLAEAAAVLRGEEPARDVVASPAVVASGAPDLADVRGQAVARRALEVAAAGGHHLLLSGPPGCGKSMLAERMAGVLPPLSLDQALEVAAIHSVAGVRPPDAPLSLVPPFRSPHHTTSASGLVGGGSGVARPGELSLAHRGILFLDEMLEMPRWVLDALRQPLESGSVRIVRTQAAVAFPADVLLVAATNPCPCGNLGSTAQACRCSPDRVERYRSRLSGPLSDRIDLQVELRPVDPDRLVGPGDGEPTAAVAARVAAARAVAAERWGEGTLNRAVPPAAVRATCGAGAVRTLASAVDQLALSARSFDRALRVARTIADLAGETSVSTDHVDEAVAYRLATRLAAT